jgi:hypothetical protein
VGDFWYGPVSAGVWLAALVGTSLPRLYEGKDRDQ